MDQHKFLIFFLQQILVNPGNLQIGNTNHCEIRTNRINQRAENVEKSFQSKVFAKRPYRFECRMEKRRVQKTDIPFFQIGF